MSTQPFDLVIRADRAVVDGAERHDVTSLPIA